MTGEVPFKVGFHLTHLHASMVLPFHQNNLDLMLLAVLRVKA